MSTFDSRGNPTTTINGYDITLGRSLVFFARGIVNFARNIEFLNQSVFDPYILADFYRFLATFGFEAEQITQLIDWIKDNLPEEEGAA